MKTSVNGGHMKDKKEFYSIPELAKLMHMSRIGVFKKVQRGEIKAKKIGKAYAVPSSEAEDFIVHDEPARYGEVVIYKPEKGTVELAVKLNKETVWLTAAQMSMLFERDKKVIFKHVNNVIEDGELDEDSVVAKFATTAVDGKKYNTEHYNLDMIISVGYRVKSKAGVQFRIWATNVLKQYVLKGYSINEKLLAAEHKRFEELKQAIAFISSKTSFASLEGQEKELINILHEYASSLTLLFEYDEESLEVPHGTKPAYELSYGECVDIIAGTKSKLAKKGEAGDLFGLDNKKRLEGILGSLYQTFGGEELYRTVEEKAAHLLYFVIKDHPFSDGNKRLASLFFIYFLKKNGILYGGAGAPKINDRGLAAIALLVAASSPKEKDIMVKLVMNLIA
jgi:prophage maintenance system killer protein